MPRIETPFEGCMQLSGGRPTVGSVLSMELRESCDSAALPGPLVWVLVFIVKEENTFQHAPKPKRKVKLFSRYFPQSNQHTIRWHGAHVLLREP